MKQENKINHVLLQTNYILSFASMNSLTQNLTVRCVKSHIEKNLERLLKMQLRNEPACFLSQVKKHRSTSIKL